jgi:lipopolysaccharide cholinephosphotransferase
VEPVNIHFQEEAKKLREIQIEILDEAVRICKKHNLRYFLDGGTLIGAVRHKGFIPWDDDIDIGMFREDYDKFIRVCKHELSSSYYLQSSETYKSYWLKFAKIRKNNTIFIEGNDIPYLTGDHKGIYIDIFPFDNVSLIKICQQIQYYIINKVQSIIWIKRGYGETSTGIVKKRFFAEFLPYAFLHWLQKRAMLFGPKNSKYIIPWSCIHEFEKEIFLKDLFLPFVEVEFEGKKYNAPKQWDIYLKQLYGDYMQLPPLEKRINHSPKKLIFNAETSY